MASKAREHRERFFSEIERYWRSQWLSSGCESPIERSLMFSLATEAIRIGLGLAIDPGDWVVHMDPETFALYREWKPSGKDVERLPAIARDMTPGNLDVIRIFKQVHVGEYRADFVVQWHFAPGAGPPHESIETLVVECDGHDFHERTKEQAARDRKRDRALTRLGLRLFRFTGSEIHKDANACSRQILEFLYPHAESAFKRAAGNDEFEDDEDGALDEVGG